MSKWQDWNPIGYWMIVKSDVRQEATSGGIFIIEDNQSTAVSYYTGQILRYGELVLDFLNLNREEKLTGEDLLNRKLVYKHYLSEAVKFLHKDEDGQSVFLLHIADPNLNIVGLCDDETVEVI